MRKAACANAAVHDPSVATARTPPTPALQHLDRLSFLQHREDVVPALKDRKEKVVYYRIANHYK